MDKSLRYQILGICIGFYLECCQTRWLYNGCWSPLVGFIFFPNPPVNIIYVCFSNSADFGLCRIY